MSFAAVAPSRLFTIVEVDRMVETGILREDERLELLEGRLLHVPTQGPPWAGLLTLLLNRLLRLYPEQYRITSRSPLECGPDSLPEPDLMIVLAPSGELQTRYPRGEETRLVVEITETSRELDRYKAQLYARARVPVYWLLDLPLRRVEVHEEPQPDGRYRITRTLAGNDTVTPPGTSAVWTVEELLLSSAAASR